VRRVLFVENRGQIVGGGQLSLLALLRGLDRSLYDGCFVCPEEGSMSQAVRELEIPVQVMGLPPLRSIRVDRMLGTAWRLRQHVRRERADLVHANGSRCMFYAGLAGRLAGVPVVWHVRIAARDRGWDRILAGLAARIVVVSGAVRPRFAWSRQAVRVVYNGVDLELYSKADGTGIRREFGAAEGYLVGMVARLTEEKDHETFLRAAARIAAQVPQARFLVVGGDPDPSRGRRRALEGLAVGLGLGERVIFTGQRQDVPQLMAGLDLLVHCARDEAFGRALVEAMAAGTPAVATAVGGIPEVVVDGQTGLLVKPGDPQAVERAAVSLLEDPERRTAMGQAGRVRAAKLFSLEAHAAQVQRLYEEILG